MVGNRKEMGNPKDIIKKIESEMMRNLFFKSAEGGIY